MSYTHIRHDKRKELKLTIHEYCLADLVYQLSTNPENEVGWCYASKEWIAGQFEFSRRTVVNLINKLVEKGIVYRNEQTSHLRTTSLWNQTVPSRGEEFSKGVNFLHSNRELSSQDGCELSSHNNNILDSNKDNNIYNTLNNFIQERERVVRELEPKFKDKDIGKTFDTLVDYCQAKNKKYKNYKSALSNWLRNDDRNQFSKLPTKTNNYQSIQL